MKLLLVQVPTSHLGAGEKVYPLGLSRLSSMVPKHIEKYGLDMNICQDPWMALNQSLKNISPDIVALSFRNLDPLAGHHTSYVSSLKTAAMLVKNLLPKTRILAGGPAFSMFAQQLMSKIQQIDIGIKGEGESVFPVLLAHKLDPVKIPGIVWRNGQKIMVNTPGSKISMDDIPPMDLQTFSPSDYTKKNAYVATMGIEGKRGCDLFCGYCLYPFLGGSCMRLRSPAKIADEMEMLHKEHKISLFHFTDSVVNRPLNHFEEVCRELILRKLDISWTGFFREDSLTQKNLTLAKKAGLCAIYFSADALTRQGLKLLNKKMTIEDIFNASHLTVKNNILTMCHFLINLPFDNDKQVQESLQMLETLLNIHASRGNLGAVILNHIRLYPMASLTQKLIRSKQLDPETDLLYPIYHNPEPYKHILHEFEAICNLAGVFSQLGITLQRSVFSISKHGDFK